MTRKYVIPEAVATDTGFAPSWRIGEVGNGKPMRWSRKVSASRFRTKKQAQEHADRMAKLAHASHGFEIKNPKARHAP